MSVLTSLGVLILTMLSLAFFQLVPSVFSLFLHFTSGRYSKFKTSDLAVFFILGTETFTVFILLFIYFLLFNSPSLFWIIDNSVFSWLIAGILAALGILIFTLYYRRHSRTELFISRKLARSLQARAKTIKTRSDAFAPGFTSALPEFAFTLPLYIVSTITIMQFNSNAFTRAGIIILFALFAILPLLIIFFLFNTGHTLADSLRFRTRNYHFLRICLALFYFLIAILIISGAVL